MITCVHPNLENAGKWVSSCTGHSPGVDIPIILKTSADVHTNDELNVIEF